MKTLVRRELEELYAEEIQWMCDFQKKGSFESLDEHEKNCFEKMHYTACVRIGTIWNLWDDVRHNYEDKKKLHEITQILSNLGEYKEELFEPNED